MTHHLRLSNLRCVKPCLRQHRRHRSSTSLQAATPSLAPWTPSAPPLAKPFDTLHPPSPLHATAPAAAEIPNHAKAFVKALRRCGTLPDLHHLLHHYQPHLDSQAISAAASFYSDTMAGRSSCQAPGTRPLQHSMRRLWLPLFIQHLPRMDAVGLCICVQSAAKVSRGLSPPSHDQMPILDELTLDSVLGAADAQLPAFSSRSATQLLWGLTSLGFQPPAPWLARFLSTATPARSLPRASPQDLVILLWCLAKLRTLPPEPWLCQLMQAAALQLPRFDGQQLGMTMWALSALGVRPGERFMAAVMERATALLGVESTAAEQQQQQQQQQATKQGSVHSGNVDRDGMGASSTHRQDPSSSQEACRGGPACSCSQAALVGSAPCRQAAASGEWSQQPCRQQGCPGPPQCRCPPSGGAHMQTAASQRLGAGNGGSTGGSCRELNGAGATGAALLQVLPDGKVRQDRPAGDEATSYSSIRDSRGAASAQPVCAAAAVGQLCHALLMLDLQPSAAFCQAVLAATVRPSLASSPQPQPPQLAPGMGLREAMLLLMGLARWRCTPDARWQQALLRSSAGLLPAAGASEVAGLLWGLAQLCIRPPAAWMLAAEERLLQLLPQLSPLSTARCLIAFGYLRYTPGPLLASRLLHLLCANMDKVAAKKLFPAMLAAGTLQLPVPARQLRVLVQGPAAQHKWHYCSFHNLAQHAYALVLWGVQPGAMWCVQLLEAAEDKLLLMPAAEPSAKELLLLVWCVTQLLRGLAHEGQAADGILQPAAAQAPAGAGRSRLARACLARAGEMTQPQLMQLVAAGGWLGLGPAELSKLRNLSASMGAAGTANWAPGPQQAPAVQWESNVCTCPVAG